MHVEHCLPEIFHFVDVLSARDAMLYALYSIRQNSEWSIGGVRAWRIFEVD